MKPAPETLALRQAQPQQGWQDGEWQRLWLALHARPWTSLAICPAGAGVSLAFSLNVAVALARTGMLHRGQPIQVADGTDLKLSELADFAADVKSCTASGSQILIALAPITANPMMVTLAQAADCSLLCALLERMSIADAKATVSKIGKDRFLGTAMFRSELLGV